MVSANLLLLAALGALGSASPLVPRVACATNKGAYIIVARGTYDGSNYPEGMAAPVANLIEGNVTGSYSVGVNYLAATFPIQDYNQSVSAGVNDAKAKIVDYVKSCGTSSRIVLLGFSQGGNVMTDLLAGGANKPPALEEKYRKNIVGVAVFGDPTFTLKQPYNSGSSTRDGLFPRGDNATSLDRLKTYANVLKSYCDEGDNICAKGSGQFGGEDVHAAEVPRHQDEAVKFIVNLIKKSQQ